MPSAFLETLTLIPPQIERGRAFIAWVAAPVALLAFGLADFGHGNGLLLVLVTVACLGTLLGALRRDWAPKRIHLLPDGRWLLAHGQHAVVEARLTASWGARSGQALGLEWRDMDGRRFALWLLAADVDQRTWRRLRVRLLIA